MKKSLTAVVMLFLVTSLVEQAAAQGGADYGSGMKINFDKDGQKSLRFIFWSQMWARNVQNNPGTLINGEAKSSTFDVGARRIRALALAQISPRYLILAHWGINNQTILNGGGSGTTGTGAYGAGKKPQMFFHDVWNEYAVIPAKDPITGKANKRTLYVGAGLHYWHGISRMTSASTLNFLTVDAPIFNWPLIENSDQFARQYGLYVKGVIGKLHYQAHLNKPFATNLTPTAGANRAVDNNGDPALAPGAYLDYQFFDQESNVLPFRVGSYIGTKKVFNIGAGFYHNARGTKSSPAAGVTKSHDISILSADVFADLPIGDKQKHMAVTVYSVLYNYNFGPNYWRSVGIMNLGTDDPSIPASAKAIEGPGDARVFMGTGNIWYTQAGLLLPKGKTNKVRVQPFAAYALKKLEAFDHSCHYFDAGCNFYLDGHHSKMTFQYSSRPTHDTNKKLLPNKGELILQFQVYL